MEIDFPLFFQNKKNSKKCFFFKKAAQFFSKKKNNAQLVGFPAKKIIPFFYIPAFFKQMNE